MRQGKGFVLAEGYELSFLQENCISLLKIKNMKRLFVLSIIAITLLVLTTSCSKGIIDANSAEEITTSIPPVKQNTNGCALITGASGSTYEFAGAIWIVYTISWTNQGGKKYIEVF